MDRLALTHTPDLRAPYLVAGFGGWANGGEVSTDVVEFLQTNLRTESLGEITSDGLLHPRFSDAGQPSRNGHSPGVDRIDAFSVQHAARLALPGGRCA